MPETPVPTFKWEWNINTIAVLFGFIASFIAWGYTLSELRNGSSQNARDIAAMVTHVTTLDARVVILERGDAKMDQLDYRVAQNEKALEGVDNRFGRMAESYSNQFSDMRTQLSAISTQLALTNQTLQRIEARPVVPGRDP